MLAQHAIFVDAGYLFAQGSFALTGQKQSRHQLRIKIPEVIKHLKEFARNKAPDTRLLRIYWYDAAPGSPSREQQELSYLDDVKLRLGLLNTQGQQKGVDSLIVTDLITLSQNGAIKDAILLTGDEDIRVGVQMAQAHGVRVHLLGIFPARGSQSMLLMQEADTCSEWLAQDVMRVLEYVGLEKSEEGPASPRGLAEEEMAAVVNGILAGYDEAQLHAFQQYVEASKMLPQELDGRMLREIGNKLKQGAFLSAEEKRIARLLIRKKLQEKGSDA